MKYQPPYTITPAMSRTLAFRVSKRSRLKKGKRSRSLKKREL
jgi:hypothetical protein